MGLHNECDQQAPDEYQIQEERACLRTTSTALRIVLEEQDPTCLEHDHSFQYWEIADSWMLGYTYFVQIPALQSSFVK